MTPISEYLNEYSSTLLRAYLAQLDKPETAVNLRHGIYPDRPLARSGIVPTNPIQRLNNILTEGDDPMINQFDSTRIRIYSHMTESRFLHVEDSLNIGQGKLRLFGGRYRRSEGMEAHSFHFLDLDDARVIFGALARGEQGFAHKEYKGTPPRTRPEQGRRNGSGAVSRVLSTAVKGDNVYIELKTGPGKLTNTGAITPNGPAKAEVNVGFKLYEARRMAASVLAYIHAWDVMRMMVNQQMVSPPTPYASAPLSTSLLVSTTSETNGAKYSPANGAPKPNGATRPTVVIANSDRPVTRKTNQPATITQPSPPTNGRSRNGHTTQNGRNPQPRILLYGDGTPVSADNQTERSVYARYRQAKSAVPPSKHALQQFYQQQIAA